MNAHIKSCDYITLGHDSPNVVSACIVPAALHVGDRVQITFDDEEGVLPWEGMVTEVFKGDRFKVELVADDGSVHRYSVPRVFLQLIRRADA